MTELTNHGSTGDDGEQDANTEDKTGDNVHADVLRETLEESTNNHDEGAEHDGPATTPAVGDVRSKRHTENGAQHVGGVDKTKQTGLNTVDVVSIIVDLVDTAVAEVSVPLLGHLEGVDELRVETGSHLDTHAAQEEPDVHDTQIGLLVPWDLVLLDETRDNGIRRVTDVYLGSGNHVCGCVIVPNPEEGLGK